MFDLPFELPSGWELKTVEQLVDEGIIEKPLDGNHGGIHPKSSDYVDSGIPFVMASDLENGRVNFEGCKYITEIQASNLRKGFSKPGDVLLSHKATIGRTAIVQKNEFSYILLTPQVTYYRIKNHERLDNTYLKAYFDSAFFQSILGSWAGAGSTRAYLGITGQLKLPVIVPPILSQRGISTYVGAVNAKIELNRQTNQTLEHIAQAIFKSWFVDFDPTRAKIAAKENGEDPERAAMAAIAGKSLDELNALSSEQLEKLKSTAALFPDVLVESELGEMPEGWEVKPISEWGRVICGKTPPKKDPNNFGGDIPFIKIPDMHGNVFITETADSLTLQGAKTQTNKQIYKGSICVSCIATVGQVVIASEKSHTNQQINSIIPRREALTPFLYFAMLEKNKLLHDLASGGSATLNLNTGNFSKILLTYPSDDLLDKYAELVSPNMEGILELGKQSIGLSNLRDLILPKLLSGELEVASYD